VRATAARAKPASSAGVTSKEGEGEPVLDRGVVDSFGGDGGSIMRRLFRKDPVTSENHIICCTGLNFFHVARAENCGSM
jgi:hypothetical protein